MFRENEQPVLTQAQVPETKEQRERRKALGIYYTPPEAAKILARWVIRDPEEILLEPSFGGCAMLSAAVSVFRALGNEDPSLQFYGYDVDLQAFEYLADLGIKNNLNRFKNSDFLAAQPGDIQVDAVLANPPFVSYHRQTEAQRNITEKLRKEYFPGLPKLASLWAFFVLHSMKFLRVGGRMAFVLPSAIGTADYGRALLEHLSTRFENVELVHVSERIFIQTGADERIALLLLSGYVPEGLETPIPVKFRHIFRMDDLNNDVHSLDGTLDAMDIRTNSIFELTRYHGNQLIELGTISSISIGEVVGDISVFVKPLKEWKSLKIPVNYLFPILTRSSQVVGLHVTNEIVFNPSSSIPYILIPPEKRVPKVIFDFLSLYSADEIKSNKTFEKRSIWYRCSYDSSAHAYIGSMNHEYPRILGNEVGISCSNAFYKILFKDRKDIAAWLPLICLTTPFRLSAEILGRIRGSGGIKLEPSDVRKLLIPSSIPDLSLTDFKVLRERINVMVSQGEIDAAGQLADAVIFIRTNLIDAKAMSVLRKNRLILTTTRLAKL